MSPSPHPNSALARPGLRLLSLAAIGAAMLFYQPDGPPTLVNAVVLPLVAAAAAGYLTGSLIAVALGIFLLAMAHSEPGATGALQGMIYPGLALATGLLLLYLLGQRFAAAVRKTQALRRQRRAAKRHEDDADPGASLRDAGDAEASHHRQDH